MKTQFTKIFACVLILSKIQIKSFQVGKKLTDILPSLRSNNIFYKYIIFLQLCY